MNGYQKLRNKNTVLAQQLHDFKLNVLKVLQDNNAEEIGKLKQELLFYKLLTLEFVYKDIKLWHAIPKLPSYNSVQTYLAIN